MFSTIPSRTQILPDSAHLMRTATVDGGPIDSVPLIPAFYCCQYITGEPSGAVEQQRNTPDFRATSQQIPPKTGTETCTVGPLNLSQNIQTAKTLAMQFWSGVFTASSGPAQVSTGSAQASAATGTYVGLVQTGGAWDPKTTSGATPTNVAAGNINFGATCSQFGFNSWLGGQVCQFGAGIYGKLTGNYGSPIFSQYHGDWPADNLQSDRV